MLAEIASRARISHGPDPSCGHAPTGSVDGVAIRHGNASLTMMRLDSASPEATGLAVASTPLRPTAAALARYPIPVGLIAPLYRADAGEFEALMAPLSDYARARIAAYCIERERLHALALRIAGTCTEAALVKAAGAEVGAALFVQSRVEPATQPASRPTQIPEMAVAAMQVIEFSAASWDPEAGACSNAA
ncbi:hypothetical protein [Methylobacterium planeticum]|uniref:hypothetical protein n=1 Tax=Methylobacterium planeticum TaxID=2615211 RepID=UPI001FEFF5C3|nr:hypothetical protein [Methylobacterium planeticum]